MLTEKELKATMAPKKAHGFALKSTFFYCAIDSNFAIKVMKTILNEARAGKKNSAPPKSRIWKIPARCLKTTQNKTKRARLESSADHSE